MGGKRVCEVCGIRESRRGGFFASFPLDEDRCKAWVKAVGKEDLVYVPIEKLHKLRSICGDHFLPKDINKKGNRLKKRAIPKINLMVSPLTDEQMREFPLHIASKSVSDSNILIDVPMAVQEVEIINEESSPDIAFDSPEMVAEILLTLRKEVIHNRIR